MSKNIQRKDGLYRAWYKGKQFYGKTDAEAKEKRDAYKYECEHGIEQAEPVTVFDLAEQWLPIAKASVEKNTYNQYASIMEKMTEAVGDKLVSAVTPADMKRIWSSCVGLSQSYISKAKFLYKSFFQYAIENGHCKINPTLASSAQPHRGTTGSHRALEPWEIDLIETVPHRCQGAAMFMLKAGLRRGEAVALRKKMIYGDKIHIVEAAKFIGNRPVIGDPKTESSVREVPLFAPLRPFYDAAEDYILPSAGEDICSEMAFRRVWESYLSDLSVQLNGCKKRWYHLTKDWIQSHPEEHKKYLLLKKDPKMREKAEEYRLRGWVDVSFRPHDLRHTFVTTCRDKGVDIHVCMKWCGHSSEKMILEIYDHISAFREQEALRILDGVHDMHS